MDYAKSHRIIQRTHQIMEWEYIWLKPLFHPPVPMHYSFRALSCDPARLWHLVKSFSPNCTALSWTWINIQLFTTVNPDGRPIWVNFGNLADRNFFFQLRSLYQLERRAGVAGCLVETCGAVLQTLGYFPGRSTAPGALFHKFPGRLAFCLKDIVPSPNVLNK